MTCVRVAAPCRSGYVEISGLRDVAGRYRYLFVDAYGVLYDGAAAFPGAREALLEARARGLQICIVTNSASRVTVVARRLEERAGITEDHYNALISSGEIAWDYLADHHLPADAPIYVITEKGGPAWIADIGHLLVDDVRNAKAILAIGMPFLTEAAFHASTFADTLKTAAYLGLPMIVGDSDETYPWRGVIRLAPGWLARVYAVMGGPLVEFGKPHKPIYDSAARLLDRPLPGDILAIGDNLLTDIAGAAGYGIDSMLVLEGGVHGSQPMNELQAVGGPAPTYVARRLAW